MPQWSEKHQLRDVFPENVPKTRILVYVYEPVITYKNNKISITGLAKGLLESYKAFFEATQILLSSFLAITAPVRTFQRQLVGR
ncbi:unnamed protein product [Clonostachys byssicola]|uniref:Uncharacterized protein n=1 Tax=Clonostachys byssicola TaxID=160290 RepID=A0A9N9U8X3_9HYPO|nr:unnamed protein product [Clonostachys byssicola]